MKWFRRFLIFCILNAMLVTGEVLFLATEQDNIYRYNTTTKETKKIAEHAVLMTCDYERNFIYYTKETRKENVIRIMRMDQRSGERKPISDKVNPIIEAISVDQETGNVYYASTKRIGFLSYTKNYGSTTITTIRRKDDFVYEMEIYGKGSSKRVYWSTMASLYSSEVNTTDIKDLTEHGEDCLDFSILDNGMVCFSFHRLYLANLDGVEIESLPNIAITSSILADIYSKCYIGAIETVYGNMYILCQEQRKVLKLDLKTGILYDLIPKAPRILPVEQWLSVCPFIPQKVVLPDQKAVLPIPIVTMLPVSTIVMVVIAVVSVIVLMVILAVTILKCARKRDSMPRRSDNRPSEEQAEPQSSSARDDRLNECNVYTTMPTRSNYQQSEEPGYSCSYDNRLNECNVYTTMPTTG